KKRKKVAYLTFDDGPSANTKKILDTLQKENVKATFFVIGQGLKSSENQDLVKRIAKEGHQLGNHTYTHDYSYIYSSKDAFLKELNQSEEKVKELTGKKMTIVRFPGGSNNQLYKRYNKNGEDVMAQIKNELNQKEYVYIDWNVDSTDAKTKKLKTKEEITKAVVDQTSRKDEAVILMHDAPAKTTTAEALPEIIRQLKAKGYEFDVITPDMTPVQF
ncbi:MAG: polysaccharide deacetylase, partial [Epulopiscium sp.]|nr:polysaccharide deacetylase [Candidatus Epulonipiscium sp.]